MILIMCLSHFRCGTDWPPSQTAMLLNRGQRIPPLHRLQLGETSRRRTCRPSSGCASAWGSCGCHVVITTGEQRSGCWQRGSRRWCRGTSSTWCGDICIYRITLHACLLERRFGSWDGFSSTSTLASRRHTRPTGISPSMSRWWSSRVDWASASTCPLSRSSGASRCGFSVSRTLAMPTTCRCTRERSRGDRRKVWPTVCAWTCWFRSLAPTCLCTWTTCTHQSPSWMICTFVGSWRVEQCVPIGRDYRLHYSQRTFIYSGASSRWPRKTTSHVLSGWTPNLFWRCQTFMTQLSTAQCCDAGRGFALRCPYLRCYRTTSSTCVESTWWTRPSATIPSTTDRRSGGDAFSSTEWWCRPTTPTLSRKIRATTTIDRSGRHSSTFSRTSPMTLLGRPESTEPHSCLGCQHAHCKPTHSSDCLQSDGSAESAHSHRQLVREPKQLTMDAGSAPCLFTRSVWVPTFIEPTLVDNVHVTRTWFPAT